MYPTSDDYKIAIAKNARAHKISGTIGGHIYTGEAVIMDSFVYKNQLCPATKILLGGVYIGECDLVFSKAFAESLNIRGTWKGRILTVWQSVEAIVDDEPTFIPIPLGVFTVEQATWNDKGLAIVAYDNMSKLDKPMQFDQSSGTLFSYLSYICSSCGVALGMTEGEVRALPNGTRQLGIYPGSSMQTYRDAVSRLAEVACCYATMNRSGELVLRRLPNYEDVVDVVSDKMRYSTSFSDYTSYYSNLSVTNMDDGSESIYNNSNIGGLTMELGDNPFLQYGVTETVVQLRQAIIDALQGFRATPFKVSCLPNPAYDLGDLIEFTGGIGQGALGCVMSFIMKVKLTTIEGYGENPAASAVQSNMEKQIVSQSRNQKGESLSYYSYINTTAISLQTTSKRLYKIAFATADVTTIDLWHEIKWNITTNGEPVEIIYEYYLDGVRFDYQPVDRFGFDGYDTRPHPFYLLDVTGNQVHYWEVRAKLKSGSAVANPGDIHAELRGQRLVGQSRFDGLLEVTDEFTPWTRHRHIATYIDTPTVEKIGVDPDFNLSESFTPWSRHRALAEYVDSVDVHTEIP